MIDLQKLFDGCMRFVEKKIQDDRSWPPLVRAAAVSAVDMVRLLVDTAGIPELESFLRAEGVLTD